MKIARIYLLIAILCSSWAVHGERLEKKDVPQALKDWIHWSIGENNSKLCPFLYNSISNHQCAWPGELKLELKPGSSKFSQTWTVHAKSWIHLPGDHKHWPQSVMVNKKPGIVTGYQGRPSMLVEPGHYQVSGIFSWSRIPKSLKVPPRTGLLSVTVNGKAVELPHMDEDGNVWLRGRQNAQPQTEQDNLNIQVFRRIVDEIPLQQHTRIELEVSGRQREITLGPVQSADLIPLHLESPLPAQWDRNGRLRVQLRPGHWVMTLKARSTQNTTSLRRPKAVQPWPDDEVWVFDARHHIRLVEVGGLQSVDPRQTNLPASWQNLPAYRIGNDQVMKMNVIRRGDPDPVPDKLHLTRHLWLDFQGKGYTLHDRISGSMNKGWRLEGGKELTPGRVAVNNQPKFITRLPGNKTQGVEIREGRLNIAADSRYLGGIGSFSAVGWNHDFQSVEGSLYLPPGWTAFALWGTDNNPDTWLQRWTLLDLFMVLVLTVVVFRLWNAAAAAVALVILAITWHEPGAPHFIWANLLAVIALLRALAAGWFKKWLQRYYYVSVLALAVFVIPFMISEVRTALYPQLDQAHTISYSGLLISAKTTDQTTRLRSSVGMLSEEPAPWKMEGLKLKKPQIAKQSAHNIAQSANLLPQNITQQIDPNAVVQTGPGLPNWQWKYIGLSWNGPVKKDQRVTVLYLSPLVNGLLGLVGALGTGLMALFVSGIRFGKVFDGLFPVLTAFMAVAMLLTPKPAAAADFPHEGLLEELQTRLLSPPSCESQCADIARMRLDIDQHALSGVMEVHVLADTAIPLPANAAHWWPGQILVNGKTPQGLIRHEHRLWLQLKKGLHRVQFSGTIPRRNSFQLHFLLAPRFAQIRAGKWHVDGIHEDGTVDNQLQFTRKSRETSQTPLATLEPTVLPPFVNVNRTLELGLDWYVTTRITRASPAGTAAVIEVPLLNGESVTSEDIRVKNNKVLVNLNPSQNEMSWRSTLKKSEMITLTAVKTSQWSETWLLQAGPTWHVEHHGLAPVAHKDEHETWAPLWRPWPGESIKLNIIRPLGEKGATLTIDQSRIGVTPGARATDVSLKVTLRASQGQQHSFVLPDKSDLQSITIDGKQQPIRLQNRTLTLPVHPGKQTIAINWRQPQSISTWFSTPPVNLGHPHVNQSIRLNLGKDRWVMAVGGPALGPAVLVWGVLIVLTLVAVFLGRTGWTPLSTVSWILLGIGLSQTSIWSVTIVAGWLLILEYRKRMTPPNSAFKFNLLQIFYVLLTLTAIGVLLTAVQRGLLGPPDMMVSGNRSDAYSMNWYQDRGGAEAAQAWVISLPILLYRILMLLWALWLALALVNWLKWGWQCFNTHGAWRKIQWKWRGIRKKAGTAGDHQETGDAQV